MFRLVKAIDAFEYATEEVKMKRRVIKDRQDNMQKYVDDLANQIVDREADVMGNEMAKRTKENIKKITEKENKRKEAINEEKTKVKQITDEERRRKLLAKKRRMMKEREENEKDRKKQSNG